MEHDSRRKFVIDLTPELERILKTTRRSTVNVDTNYSLKNAISGERNVPMRSLRRGLLPQE